MSVLSIIAEKGVLLADGGMGTGLFARGLMTGDSPELWNVDRPAEVAAVHRGFIEAGSDLVLTNSFGGNRHRLALHGAEARMRELCMAAAGIARGEADRAGRRVLVAGDIGPTGELLAPLGPLEAAEARESFAGQAMALAEGGVDLLWIETMSSLEEMGAALEGAAEAGLPIVATFTFDTGGRTMMGITPGDMARAMQAHDPRPFAYGANCGIGPSGVVRTLLELAAARQPGDVLVAKGNCGIPEFRDGKIRYSGTPEIMAAYARLARDAGAGIIGGCCGTGPEHLVAMRRALDETPPGDVPDAGAILAALGPGAPPTDGERAARPARRRRQAARG